MTAPPGRWADRFSPTTRRVLAVPLGVALVALLVGPIEAVNRDLVDRALRWSALRQPSDPKPYVLVEIDDRSIEALGRFPWSRSAFADLLARTREGGAAVVGLDVIFAEPADSAGDAAFREALVAAGNVVLASAPSFATPDEAPAGALARLRAAADVVEPLAEFSAGAAGVGSVAVLEDSDGSLRLYPVVVAHGGEPYPSFAQLVASAAMGDPAGAARVPADGMIVINYGSLSPAAVVRLSFVDALRLSPQEARAVFEGKVVIVGAAYTGGVDYGPTPLSPRTPIAFAQIYAVHTLVSGKRLAQLPGWTSFLFAVLIVGLLSTQIPARQPTQLLALAAALAVVLLAGGLFTLLALGVVIEPALPLLATGLTVSSYGLEQWWSANLVLRRRNEVLQETLENLSRTRADKERMEAELNIAREIQLSMLPLDFSAFQDRGDLGLHATLVPAREVGGDFYDFFLMDEDHLCMCVADVSGKGVPAALFMAVAKVILRSNASRERSPGAILTRANDELAQGNTASMFVSVWLGMLDLGTGELTYANAGHNPPYVWTPAGELSRLQECHGPVLAGFEDMDYGEGILSLAPGDLVLLYTDGVTEAMTSEGALYGEERLRDLIRASAPGSAKEMVEVALEDVWRFQGDALQADDVTILAVQYRGRPAA